MRLGAVIAMVPLVLGACSDLPATVDTPAAPGGEVPPPNAVDGDLTTVVLALTSVPATVHCVQVVAVGSTTTTTRLDVTPTSSTATLTLGRLPLGDTVFRGSAFDNSCSAISGTQPSWVADPTSVSLRAGVAATVTLTFRTNPAVTASANFVQSAVAVTSAKASFETFMVMADGTVRATGGIFGGTVFSSNSLTTPLTDVQELATGQQFYCFIKKADGSVWCAGINRFGECGPNAPVSDTARIVTPVNVPFPAGVGRATHIVAGLNHACATVIANSSGIERIYCWGLNNSGQLGERTPTPFPNPNPIQAQTFSANLPRTGGFQIAAGYFHTCVNAFTGVSCWGGNSLGQIGNGTTTDAFFYTDVPDTGGTVSLAMGAAYTCALRGDGTVRCWGDNRYGQLGDGTFDPRLSPSPEPSVIGVDNATQIASSGFGNCVLRVGGKVSCWGSNFSGEVGDGTADDRPTAVDVRGLSGSVLTLMGGIENEFAIMTDRTIQAWGQNAIGSLGDGTRIPRFAPVPVLVQ